MIKNRTGSLAAALALTAATTVAVAPAAHAAPTTPATATATVHYVAQDTGAGTGSATGSLDSEFVQVGLVLIAGIGISALLAIGAGVAGGGIDLPEIPGLPF